MAIGRGPSGLVEKLDARAYHGCGMNLTNESYVITISTRTIAELYYRDKSGWMKVSARGRKYRATAEQVLNHVLPALAGVKPNVIVKVEHYEKPGDRPIAHKDEAKGADIDD